MSAQEHYRIDPSHFLAECRKKRLNWGSFVWLCFLFAFSGLCLVFVLFSVFLIGLLFSSMNQCEWHWIA